jgi:flagellar biosynthetic protein FliO
MGQVKWQWLAIASLLLALTAAAPANCDQPQDATSTTTSQDDTAAANESNAAAEQADEDAAADAAEECAEDILPLFPEDEAGTELDDDAGNPLAVPPLAPELVEPEPGPAGEATEITAVGVTAPSAPPVENTAEPAPATVKWSADNDQGIAVPPLHWTPSSGRFALSERQDELSLRAEADTMDRGDARPPASGTKPKPAPPPAKTAKPQSGSQTQPSAEQPDAQAAPADEAPGLLAQLDLPDAESATDDFTPATGPSLVPSEQFTSRELADTPTGTTLNAENAEPQAEPAQETAERRVGVISTQKLKAGHEPTLGEVLKGEAPDSALGSQVPGISPWRSIAVVLVCLALLFIGIAASKKLRGPFKLGKKSLQVMENISLGTGRQITIVEMGESALILGVTPQSINLLDKVPLGLMNRAYQGTINAIINRESEALPEDWAQRPLFTVAEEPASPRLAPPLNRETYGPTGRRVSVGELRRSRGARHLDETGLLRPPAGRPGLDLDTKSELISRIRAELDRLEE